MAKRIIQSPGLEIREVDLSLRTPSPAGTTIYATGFTDQGPADEPINISSLQEFIDIYGAPKTPAERYFYQTVKGSFQSQARITVNRLPYGDGNGAGFGETVGILAYPALTVVNGVSGKTLSDDEHGVNYFIGRPTQFNISTNQYRQLVSGELFTWSNSASASFTGLSSLANAAMIVVNKAQTIVDGKFNGYYVGIADNTLLDSTLSYEAITRVKTVTTAAPPTGLTSFDLVPNSRLDFALTATAAFGDNPKDGSISQIIKEKITSFDLSDNFFNDTLNIGVFKLRQSAFNTDANSLAAILEEGFNGSIGFDRQTTSEKGGTPVNFFLENVAQNSRNVEILVNPFISGQFDSVKLNADGTPKNKVRVLTSQLQQTLSTTPSLSSVVGCTTAIMTSLVDTLSTADSLFPVGSFSDTKATSKFVGNIPQKLTRALDGIRNTDIYDIDIIAEGGLGTIWAYCNTASGPLSGFFDDTKSTTALQNLSGSTLSSTAQPAIDSYNTIFSRFSTFVGPMKDGGRGDIIFIADPIRQILVNGKDSKVIDDPSKNFTQHIYWPLRHQFANANTSYACVYANYIKLYDDFSGLFTYSPPSGFVAAKMASTDAQLGPWGAPAGFERGTLPLALDLAFVPNQRQRDDLYNISINPIASFPDQGIVVFGQKTLLKKPSAFDRINVRRNFLYLEKATKSVMKFFIFENNTLFTRTQVVNTLSPFFERVKQADGLTDYLIVCDDRNNTAEVIDNNELIVDIYIKPVRTAEFIRINFYATRTDANFEELIGG
jgi:hypothetical protein